ncbi:MAG: ligase-associated DNA damage response exonuclease [Bacteroidia bacterium]
MALLTFSNKGIYCQQADIYIDPWRPVKNAIITHAHSDHARFGSSNYLCHINSLPLLQARLGNEPNYQTLHYNEQININGVKISLHPAGHVVGSAQIRLEYNNEVWVVSGDYKTQNDGISIPFEPVKCDVFITESTFGLPIYNWKSESEIFRQIQSWVYQNQENKQNSVIFAYSLGKAQRVLKAVSHITENIFVHGAVYNMNEAVRKAGIELPNYTKVDSNTDKSLLKNAVIIAPPSAMGSPWLKKFAPYQTAV